MFTKVVCTTSSRELLLLHKRKKLNKERVPSVVAARSSSFVCVYILNRTDALRSGYSLYVDKRTQHVMRYIASRVGSLVHR